MKTPIKFLIITLTVFVTLLMVNSAVLAQQQPYNTGLPPLWDVPSFQSQPMMLPTWGTAVDSQGRPIYRDILVDNFEYWDSPYNHGWTKIEPPYPVYGFGTGYATLFNTVLDFQKGSRVLDVYRPSSVFLLNTAYERLAVQLKLTTPAATSVTGAVVGGYEGIDVDPNGFNPQGVISFEFRAPVAIEPWDMFEFAVVGITVNSLTQCYQSGGQCYSVGGAGTQYIEVRIRMIEPTNCGPYNTGPWNTTEGMFPYVASIISGGTASDPITVVAVDVGREFLDGTWHTVWLNLAEAISSVISDPGLQMKQAIAVRVSGQAYRLDNIAFRATPNSGHVLLDYPDLFEMGPLYGQLFEPYRYLFVSDYAGASLEAGHPHIANHTIESDSVLQLMLHPELFLINPADIINTWVKDLLAIDPAYHEIDANHASYDPNYTNRWMPGDPNFGQPESRLGGFIINATLPVFSVPEFRIGGTAAQSMIRQGTLGWNGTIGSYGQNAVQAFLLDPLPINPYDGMPTYLPAYYDALDCIEAYGRPYFDPQLVYILECALFNAGLQYWPNIAYMDYVPQTFEDLIMTIEVTNGVHSDVRTFPVAVVNYPVENYAPVLQLDIDDQLFYVGATDPHANEYIMSFVDPDCFIFSLNTTNPATTHSLLQPRNDMDGLVFNMTLNNLPAYQYGPWIEPIIDAHTGRIHFDPKFEGVYDIVVTCTDARGGVGVGAVSIFCVQTGTWLNHPPIVLGGPTQPVVLKAGEEFILHTPNFAVEDPDGDKLYCACNNGACGRDANGAFIWTFQTNFPGFYEIAILFYDIRGGYAIMEFFVDVKPWWSY